MYANKVDEYLAEFDKTDSKWKIIKFNHNAIMRTEAMDSSLPWLIDCPEFDSEEEANKFIADNIEWLV